MSDENRNDLESLPNEDGDLNKDECPTFAAFLEQMAARNAEILAEFNPEAVCATCGKVHHYPKEYSEKQSQPKAS
jgi:hypothetical protein